MNRIFRLLTTVSLNFFIVIGSGAANATRTTGVEERVYNYDILREGAKVGSHQVKVQYRNDVTLVESRSIIEIGLLGLTFYRFEYDSQEEWDNEGLQRLQVRVDDDGEKLTIRGSRSDDVFQWTINDANSLSHEMPIFPTNHWNPGVISQNRVLNTLTGNVNRVTIQSHEKDVPITVENRGDVKAFRYAGDLSLDSWYDVSGRWMGMRFEGKDGSTIEYRCKNCDTWKSL